MENLEKLLELIPLKLTDYYTENYIYNNEFIKDKKKCIEMLLDKDGKCTEWLVNFADKIDVIPLEGYLLLSKELKKYEETDGDILSLIEKLNDMLIDKLLKEIHFNIDKEILYNLVEGMKVSNNQQYRKTQLLIKINKLKKLEDLSTICTNNCIISFNLEDISKNEITVYFAELDNYYYIPEIKGNVLNFETGKVITSLNNDIIYKENKVYNLFDFIRKNKDEKIIIENKYERFLFYEGAKYLSKSYIDGKSVIVNEVVKECLLDYKDLLESNIQNIILDKFNKNNIGRYINKLEKYPQIKTLRDIINICNNVDIIFEILKYAPKIIEENIPVDIYIEGIGKCNEISKHNIKLALFCEELLSESPVIIESIVNFLEGLYRKRVYTENTVKILKYLECTIRDNKIIDETLIGIKAENGLFDNDFIEKFLNLYSNSSNKKNLDLIINKFINNKNTEFNSKLYFVIYDFYKRNEDIQALNKLCNKIISKKYRLKDFNIKERDIIKLLNYYKKIEMYDASIIFYILQEFKDSEAILNKGFKIIEKMDMLCIDKVPLSLQDSYFEIISNLKDGNSKVYDIYIDILINKRKLLDYKESEIIDLEAKINDSNNSNIKYKIKVINIIINYYIRLQEYGKAIDKIKIYLNNFSGDDNGELFRNILINDYSNIRFIEQLLISVNFSEIDNIEQILNIIFNRLIENERYEFIIEILRYYKESGKYDKSIFVFKSYLEKMENISSFNYEIFIEPILENLDFHKKKEIYDILVLRKDLPIELRERFYTLNTSLENTNYIIKEFELMNTDTVLAKNLSLKRYYDNDEKFIELINYGEDDDETLSIILKKVSSIFKDDKYKVMEILKDEIVQKDNRFKIIREYAENYLYNPYDEKNIYGEYVIYKKIYGEICDDLNLENIFKGDFIDAILFKDYIVYDILINYLQIKRINYQVIDENVITILEEINSNKVSLIKLINNFKDLVKLQLSLKSNNKCMIEFLSNSFIISEKGFIPKSLRNITDISEEYISRNKKIFDNVKGIKDKDDNIIINEVNIVKVMIHYINNIINLENYFDINEKVRRDFISEIILNDKIINFEDLYRKITEFIENKKRSFEELSYKEQEREFNNLSSDDKLKLIKKVIINKDNNPTMISKVIDYEEIPEDFKEEYLIYLVHIFNHSCSLQKIDYNNIYERVVRILVNIDKEKIDNIRSEIENLFILAVKKCDFKNLKHTIIRDLTQGDFESLGLDIAYIINRVKKE